MSVYLNIVALGLAIFGIHYWLNHKTYIFEAEDIARIAKREARKGEICMHAYITQPNHDSFVNSSERFPVSAIEFFLSSAHFGILFRIQGSLKLPAQSKLVGVH